MIDKSNISIKWAKILWDTKSDYLKEELEKYKNIPVIVISNKENDIKRTKR